MTRLICALIPYFPSFLSGKRWTFPLHVDSALNIFSIFSN